MRSSIISAVLCLALAGCATSYSAPGLRGGVSAVPVTSDIYRVSAHGNGFTSPAQIQDYVLLKAAETARDNGAQYFAIVTSTDVSQSSTFTTPGTMQTSIVGNTAYTTYSPGITTPIFKPGQDVLIKILKEPTPSSFKASEIIAAIGRRVDRGSN